MTLLARDIFEVLVRHDVDFLIIGGLAVQAHGHLRTTMDADITIAYDHGNHGRAAAALAELGAQIAVGVSPPGSLDITDPQTLKLGWHFQLNTNAGKLDVFTGTVPGADDYSALAERAVRLDIFGMSVRVVSLEDLLMMKQHAGRPRDLEDIKVLKDQLSGSS